jgi:hypothetical protein
MILHPTVYQAVAGSHKQQATKRSGAIRAAFAQRAACRPGRAAAAQGPGSFGQVSPRGLEARWMQTPSWTTLSRMRAWARASTRCRTHGPSPTGASRALAGAAGAPVRANRSGEQLASPLDSICSSPAGAGAHAHPQKPTPAAPVAGLQHLAQEICCAHLRRHRFALEQLKEDLQKGGSYVEEVHRAAGATTVPHTSPACRRGPGSGRVQRFSSRPCEQSQPAVESATPAAQRTRHAWR